MITSHHIRIPGSSVTAMVTEKTPGKWEYVLTDNYDVNYLVRGDLDLSGPPPTLTFTPNQVARVAFLLEVEYPKS